ncbi:MAG: dephospho-CoA kinase [Saprospiraceae bacterium]
MINVGITGGIGSGKTTVCKIFESIGIPIYYADFEAKRLMYKNKNLKQKIKDLLGNQAYYSNGRLNKPYVASIVFNDKKILNSLNTLVHPVVTQDATNWSAKQNSKYCIREAALLVENSSYKQLDYLIVVTAPIEIRIKRVVQRDNTDISKVQLRIKNQLSENEKVKVADFVIDNGGEISLFHQVWKIHQILIS